MAPELDEKLLKRLTGLAQLEIPASQADYNAFIQSVQQEFSLSKEAATSLLLAIAVSYSPTQLNDTLNDLALAKMKPVGAVEMIVWLSVLELVEQLLYAHEGLLIAYRFGKAAYHSAAISTAQFEISGEYVR